MENYFNSNENKIKTRNARKRKIQ